MTNEMAIEAVRNISGPQGATQAVTQTPQVARPEAIGRFEAAMASDAVPFASEATAAWRTAQANHQALLHRIRTLSQMNTTTGASAINLVELQYDVMNLAFKQDIVTKIADKSSNAIQTLVKNQ